MRLKWTKRFTKAYRRIQKSGKDHISETTEDVFNLLITNDRGSKFVLQKRYHDHMLKGDKSGIRELHLERDCLLIYRIDHEKEIITLLDIMTHEQLRKRIW